MILDKTIWTRGRDVGSGGRKQFIMLCSSITKLLIMNFVALFSFWI